MFGHGSVGVHGHQYWVVCKARLVGVISNGTLGAIGPCYICLQGVFGGEGGGVWLCRGEGWVELGDGNGPLPGQGRR